MQERKHQTHQRRTRHATKCTYLRAEGGRGREGEREREFSTRMQRLVVFTKFFWMRLLKYESRCKVFFHLRPCLRTFLLMAPVCRAHQYPDLHLHRNHAPEGNAVDSIDQITNSVSWDQETRCILVQPIRKVWHRLKPGARQWLQHGIRYLFS